MIHLLGGKERLEACRMLWLEDKVVDGTGKIMIHQDKELTDVDAPASWRQQ
jgi:hypothetical protein